MTGPEQPETFVLLRFDALEGNLCSVAIPGETVVLVNGRPATLADAAEQAGPAQAAAALMETLDIEIDNYLYCTADRLVDLAAGFGTARIPLANYMTPEALGQLQLNIPGVQTVSLTPQMLADVLAAGAATPDMQALLRAEGYLAFLRIGGDALADTVPDAVRAVLAQSSTNLTATQIFDYERIFGFLRKEPPQYRAGVLPGTWADGRYELAENSVTVAAAYLVQCVERRRRIRRPGQCASGRGWRRRRTARLSVCGRRRDRLRQRGGGPRPGRSSGRSAGRRSGAGR